MYLGAGCTAFQRRVPAGIRASDGRRRAALPLFRWQMAQNGSLVRFEGGSRGLSGSRGPAAAPKPQVADGRPSRGAAGTVPNRRFVPRRAEKAAARPRGRARAASAMPRREHPPQGRLRGEARCGRGPLAARPGALRRLPATLPPAAPPAVSRLSPRRFRAYDPASSCVAAFTVSSLASARQRRAPGSTGSCIPPPAAGAPAALAVWSLAGSLPVLPSSVTATFSLRNGTKRQFGTVRRGLPGSLGLSWPRRRPKTPGRGRPPFPRGRGHRTKPPFCATSGRKGGGATPGPCAAPGGGDPLARCRPPRSRVYPRAGASTPPPPGPCALGATSPACGRMPGRGRALRPGMYCQARGPGICRGPLLVRSVVLRDA